MRAWIASAASIGLFALLGSCSSGEPTEPTSQTDEELHKACGILCAQGCKLGGDCKCHCGPGTPCGTGVCAPKQTCCSGQPFPEPTCINGTICPISRAKYKKDIAYVDSSELAMLHDEIVGYKLATYRYKPEAADAKEHLGFIIDDVPQDPSVGADGEHVDMYGYTTMAVAALQVQAKQIADLQREMKQLQSRCK